MLERTEIRIFIKWKIVNLIYLNSVLNIGQYFDGRVNAIEKSQLISTAVFYMNFFIFISIILFLSLTYY